MVELGSEVAGVALAPDDEEIIAAAICKHLEEGEIHENQAAAILAKGLAGEGITWKDDPKEGKISLHAAMDGLLVVDTAPLAALNMVDEVMCATLHSHTLVKRGEQVAATRAIPLVMKRAPIERAAAIACQNGGVVSGSKTSSSRLLVARWLNSVLKWPASPLLRTTRK
jgi:hypothetical protein